MISLKLIIYLSIGTLAMYIPIALQTRWYGVKFWKSIPLALFLTLAGTVGTYIMYFVETGYIGGTSFFGAVFFVPLAFLPVAKLLRLDYGTALDLCAPGECVMLAIMKVQCLLSDCCKGRVLFEKAGGEIVRFPSQIVEMCNALILAILLLALCRKKENRWFIYPMYMLLYGCTRFVLNWFREDLGIFALGMPAGNFWSVWAIALGAAAWIVLKRKNKQS